MTQKELKGNENKIQMDYKTRTELKLKKKKNPEYQNNSKIKKKKNKILQFDTDHGYEIMLL